MVAAVRTVAIRHHRPIVTDPRFLIAALLIAAAVALPTLTAGAADRPAVQPDAPAVEIYVDSGWRSASRMTRLNPDTLADLATGPAIETCASSYSCAISADGSTVVTTDGGRAADDESSPRSTIVVRDGLAGPERARFELPGHLVLPRLSEDGFRLVVQRINATDWETAAPPPPLWDVYRTADGELLATVEADGPNGWHESRIDPAASRIYHFAFQPVGGATTPWPVELVAHDLTTGAEVGRLWLPEVLTGIWTTERVVGGDAVQASLTPGLAISPDGRQIALVHADREVVTLIDTDRLEVERTVEFVQPTGLTDRVLGLLSLAPQTAQAKEPMEGASAWAIYSVDGRFLYVWGHVGEIFDDGRGESRDTGLKLVNLESGEIQGEALDRVGIHSVHLTPDGRNLYVIGWDQPRSLSAGEDVFPLLRLDAGTLDTLAMRPFNGINLPSQVILQAVPNR